MNDIMESVRSYLSAGNALLRGKRLFVYLCLFIITIAGMIPTTIKACLDPSVTTVLPSTVKSVVELADPYLETSGGNTSAQDTEFKSEGQLLGEKLAAERAASRKAMMEYVGIFIDWVYTFLIGGILTIGMCSVYLRLSKREVGIKDLFSGFTSGNYLNKVLALLLKNGILLGIAAIEAVFILFIPGLGVLGLALAILGIVASYALFMVEFILADDPSISFLRAVQISFKASSGFKAALFVIDLITRVIPTLVGSFAALFLCIGSIIDRDESQLIQALFVALGLELFLMLIKPIRDGAFAAAYEDAKMRGKSYGIISQFELFDPEDEIDNTDNGGMIFFG